MGPVVLAEIAQAAAASDTGLVVAVAGGSGVAIGALLAGVFTLYGQRREHQREHERWLRDQRLEAYVAYEEAVIGLHDAAWVAHDTGDFEFEVAPLWHAEHIARTRLMFLGPDAIRAAAMTVSERLRESYRLGDVPPGDLSEKFGAAAEKVLKTSRGRDLLSRLESAVDEPAKAAPDPVE